MKINKEIAKELEKKQTEQTETPVETAVPEEEQAKPIV